MKLWQAGWMAAAAGLCLALASGSIHAQSRSEPDAEFGEGLEPFEADGPLFALVSLQKQQLRLFDRNGVVAETRVSTGRKGYDTPEGVFSLIERKVEHNSNLYDDASMPFMQRITWSGVALHEGQVPNYRASHGCIRLPNEFAERLYRTTRLGTRVVVASHDATPIPVVHAMLPQPGNGPQIARAAIAVSSGEPKPSSAVGEAIEPPMHLGANLPPKPKLPPDETGASPEAPALPDPAVAMAELRQRRAAAEKRLAGATKAVIETRPLVRPKLVEMGKAEKAHRQALALARRAQGKADAAALAVDSAPSESARERATSTHFDLLLELASVQSKEQAARMTLAEATAAAEGIKDKMAGLEAERQKVQNEVRALSRRLSPMTVLVSRQLGRIYLRQANSPVLDLAVSIRQPERPLGTHVFWAIDPDGLGKSVKWLGLTLETPGGGSPVPAPATESARRGKAVPSRTAEQPVDPLATARAALDRLELPFEALNRLAPTIQAGSTIIVSDLGPSIETGPGTDIVVQTRGEEQAAANIAKFLAKKKSEALADATAASAPPAARRPKPSPIQPAALYRAAQGWRR